MHNKGDEIMKYKNRRMSYYQRTKIDIENSSYPEEIKKFKLDKLMAEESVFPMAQDGKIRFGKYKGQSFIMVAARDEQYFNWILQQDFDGITKLNAKIALGLIDHLKKIKGQERADFLASQVGKYRDYYEEIFNNLDKRATA